MCGHAGLDEGRIPDDAEIFLLCEKWHCPPSQVLKEGAFWMERGLFHVATQAQGREDREANRRAEAESEAAARRALGG